jgi:hypothetical protein
MERLDSQILAEVRSLLERRWVDLSQLRLGTTNGVVYVEGILRPRFDAVEGQRGSAAFGGKLKKEIAAIAGVRDVVLAALVPVGEEKPCRNRRSAR